MRRAVKYPIIVFFAGMLISIIVPILFHAIHSYRFGHLVGSLMVPALIVAIVIGWMSDRRHKSKNQESK